MVSEQSSYEGNGQRREVEVALNQSEVHDSEDKCKIQACTKVTILRIEGKRTILGIDKKIFHNTKQNPKSEYRGQVR